MCGYDARKSLIHSLQPCYSGPYRVLQCDDKNFTSESCFNRSC